MAKTHERRDQRLAFWWAWQPGLPCYRFGAIIGTLAAPPQASSFSESMIEGEWWAKEGSNLIHISCLGNSPKHASRLDCWRKDVLSPFSGRKKIWKRERDRTSGTPPFGGCSTN